MGEFADMEEDYDCDTEDSFARRNPTTACMICKKIFEIEYSLTNYVCPECDEKLNKE
jgi:hypothetical protein